MRANGILLIYAHSASANASTVMEHVESFKRHSQFDVWELNTAHGFPRGLRELDFSIIVLHYSLFGSHPFELSELFLSYIEKCRTSLKVCFFQDEMRNCQPRFAMINRLGIDVVYSLLERQYFDVVYLKNTGVRFVLPTLTGYVCDRFVGNCAKFSKSHASRSIDVGYRARSLPMYMGRGAQEKSDIAKGFIKHSANWNLRLDIKVNESDRIYGDDWTRFIANCRFMLGVESGTSIFDLSGNIQREVQKYLESHPDANFSQVEYAILEPFEEKINYRAISPRLFECAALKTCMILFKGNYQGILVADRHYIPLEKDFSNIADVISKMNDDAYVDSLIESAYEDLIASGEYSYAKFVNGVDTDLIGFLSEVGNGMIKLDVEDIARVSHILNSDAQFRAVVARLKRMRYIKFPGRETLKKLIFRLGYRGNPICAE